MARTQGPARRLIELSQAGIARPYLLQQAPAVTGPVPLVVQLHGRGIDPVRFDQMTGFGTLAEEAGFVLALPSAVGEIWNDGRDAGPPGVRPDDVGYLSAVIDDVIGRAPIDPGRVYVVGMSNGAAMAGRLACELADRIAAIAQVAGTLGVDVAAACRPTRPVPILSIHGSADRTAPYAGGVRRGFINRALIRRSIGPSVGVDEWAQFWVAANGATQGPTTIDLPPDTTIRTWRGPTAASDVVFYQVDGGGHTWPGSRFDLPAFIFGRTSRTFDAARVSWDFFSHHAR